MHNVTIDNKTVQVPDGTVLSEVLMKHGKTLPHLCGGRGTCKKCSIYVNGKEKLSCQYKVKSDIVVFVPENKEILSETGAKESGEITENCCLTLDIGTTTLALALISLNSKNVIKVVTRTNPQRSFGGDVMTRIERCRKNGISDLQAILIDKVNEMVSELTPHKIDLMYVAGNTAMLHLFFGVDCSSLGVFPYTAVFLESKKEKGSHLGLNNIKNVVSLPCISAFVGADLVAGLNYTGMPNNNKYNLLIDLGTNAEIVLYNEHSLLCTSAAAGPCFEGANITCGMSATDGAVYSYHKDGSFETVNNKSPKGICGTGLVDIIAELVEKVTIDETGYMDCGEFYLSKDVKLTQQDIRQFQLAKSAVYSAVLALLKEEAISFEDIGKLFISGGFSAKINIGNAVKVGLIPQELKEICTPINNSSLLGTVKYACEQNDLSVYLKNARYIDLSKNPYFSDLFIENMEF
ncbi:MAG: ASKHA domain-containing protein [Acutalibacteraceae bacterium]